MCVDGAIAFCLQMGKTACSMPIDSVVSDSNYSCLVMLNPCFAPRKLLTHLWARLLTQSFGVSMIPWPVGEFTHLTSPYPRDSKVQDYPQR